MKHMTPLDVLYISTTTVINRRDISCSYRQIAAWPLTDRRTHAVNGDAT
jgi:hypothetical protein